MGALFLRARGVHALTVLGLVLGAARPALAQSASDSATAQALFDQARTLIAQGKAAEACPKLEESQRLDPGSGTLLNLARCYEQSGRLASAWTKYLETASAAKSSGNADRESVARQQAEALRPRLSTLTIDVAPEDKDIPGLEVTRDGAVVGAAQWGLAIPADDGDHKIAARAPGHAPWEAVATVKGEGTASTATVPPLGAAPSSAGIAAPAATGGEADNAGNGGGLGTQRIAAIAAAGAGVVGLGIGTAFGVISMSDHDTATKYCKGSVCTDQRGVNAGNDAHSAGNVATIAFVVGAVGVAAGVTLWFTAPHPSSAATSVGLGFGTVQMKGSF
ncbi:MAG TPA: hypothetical protein VH062_09940 [Polyangiaceae bacterium]|jgi:serine/threonine-protein kinase|nr:hypothetical protein [Polyangiaceae bacterium]